MGQGQWFVLDLNPEPWRVGPVGVARPTQGNPKPYIGRDEQLYAYQSAVADAVRELAIKVEGQVHLKFFFWRRLDSYAGATRRITKHEVDATNLQKATEDALQGVLLDNDRLVARVTTTIVEQGTEVTPRIVIFAEEYSGFDYNELPTSVLEQISRTSVTVDDNVWSGPT